MYLSFSPQWIAWPVLDMACQRTSGETNAQGTARPSKGKRRTLLSLCISSGWPYRRRARARETHACGMP
jgi:hypothetical protein